MPLAPAFWQAWQLGHRNLPAPNPATGANPAAVTFPTAQLRGAVYLALGADLTKLPSTWVWTDITRYVRFASGISTTQGRPDWTSTVRTSTGRLTLDNRDGRFDRHNPNGAYYGQLTFNTPIWATIDPGSGPITRMQMFVNSWPARWDRSGKESFTPIECAGVMRRLLQGSVFKSPLYRAITSKAAGGTLLAYWPLESSLASGVSGGPALSGASTPPDATVIPAGSTGAIDLSGGVKLSAPVGSGTAVSTMEIEFVVSFSTLPSVGAVMPDFLRFESAASGSAMPAFGMGVDEIGDGRMHLAFTRWDSGGSPHHGFNSSAATALVVDTPVHVLLSFVQTGADVWVTMTQNGANANTTVVSSATLTVPTSVSTDYFFTPQPSSLSHLAVWSPARTTTPPNYSAAVAWVGELAHARIVRLCAEEGVALVCPGTSSQAMGPQGLDTFMNLIRDAETVDGGVLYETNWGLGFQALDDRLNLPVSMALDFHQRHVAVEPEPADDDQRLRNQWTASRSGGTSVVAEQTSGPLGTQAGGPGVYADSVTANVQADSQLGDQAGWRLHLGTVDEDRWPSIAIRLHGTPGLIPSWAALALGLRVTAANPPTQVAPDTINAIMEGWSERWDPETWDAALITAPYSPYDVNTLASDTLAASTDGRDDWDSCTVAVDSGATMTVTVTPLITTTAADFPFNVMCEGEKITVTNCSGAASPQTLTVTRSVNGITKTHPAGAVITLLDATVLTM